MSSFIDQLHEALASELEALTDLPVYRDELRLQGGDFYNEALARSLCESVCMLMVFTPTYFSSEHPYCAREFAAMRSLEQARINPGAEHGLIIPVVLRGFEDLPEEIALRRQVYRFERYSVSGPRLIRNRSFEADIRKMAEYINARTREQIEDRFNCGDFRMPADDDVVVRGLISNMASRPPAFPGRERQA